MVLYLISLEVVPHSHVSTNVVNVQTLNKKRDYRQSVPLWTATLNDMMGWIWPMVLRFGISMPNLSSV